MRLFSLRWLKLMGALAVMAAGVALATDLTGAGSTFVCRGNGRKVTVSCRPQPVLIERFRCAANGLNMTLTNVT